MLSKSQVMSGVNALAQVAHEMGMASTAEHLVEMSRMVGAEEIALGGAVTEEDREEVEDLLARTAAAIVAAAGGDLQTSIGSEGV